MARTYSGVTFFMAKKITLCALAGEMTMGTVMLVRKGFRTLLIAGLLRGDQVPRDGGRAAPSLAVFFSLQAARHQM